MTQTPYWLVMLLLLLSTSARARSTQQLHRGVYHYSYKESKNTQQYLQRRRRHYQRQEKRELQICAGSTGSSTAITTGRGDVLFVIYSL